jgi:hypothetical protein
MGLDLSKCVNLAGESLYLDESYTVVRTSGAVEDGWMLTDKIHRCSNTDPRSQRPKAHAFLKPDGWSLHLHNGDQHEEEPDKHCCGFRRLSTFWPTRLTGDQPAITAWTEQLRDRLEELAGRQGLPDLWAEHSCSKGAPADYCDGCCAVRRAKEKKALLDQLAAIAAERKTLDEKLEPIYAEKAHIHDNEDLWDPKWGDRWDDLEEAECEIYREQSALDDKAFPLKQALKKVPTAAHHRAWRTWRDAQDCVEEAQREDLAEDHITELQAEADRLRPAMEAARVDILGE